MESVWWRGAKRVASVFTILAALGLGAQGALAQEAVDRDQGETAGASEEQADDIAETIIPRKPARTQTKLTVEGLVLQRDDITTIPLTTRRLNNSGVPDTGRDPILLDTSALDPDVGEGLRASLITELFGIPLELTGFYAGDMLTRFAQDELRGSGIRTGAIYIDNIPVESGDFVGIDPRDSRSIGALVVEHQTQLWSAELITRPVQGWGLMFGLRAMQLTETFSSAVYDSRSSGNEFGDTFDESFDDIDNALIETDNLLLGAQIGIDHMFALGHGIEIGGAAKAGVYANYYDRLRAFTSQSPPGVGSCPECQRNRIRDTVEDTGLATAIELNPRLNWELAPGVALTGSGMFLWIDGISEATSYYDQVANRADKSNDNDGDIFLYGGTLGLTFNLSQISDSGAPSLSLGEIADIRERSAGCPGAGESKPSAALAASKPSAGCGVASPEELDERIAELEATAVRKGIPGVSVEISGQINKMLMWFRDGEVSDVYVADNTTSPSRFFISGQGIINRSWSAGYEFGFDTSRTTRSVAINQFFDEVPDEDDFRVRRSEMFLRHNRYGKVTMGLTSPATDNIILYNLGGTAGVASADIRLIGGGMAFRRAQRPDEDLEGELVAPIESLTVNRLAQGLDTTRRDGVRYDTPSYYGFIASAFWGENDFWDVSLRWRRSWQDWRWRLGIGYLEDTDFDGDDRKESEWKGSAALIHLPTGLYANAAYLRREFDGTDEQVLAADGGNLPAFEYWYVQSGIRKNWSGAGDTSVFGEYAETSDAASGRDSFSFDEITESPLTMIGAGVVQELDSIKSEIYLGYRRFDAELRGVDNGAPEFEEFDEVDLVYSGMRIKF